MTRSITLGQSPDCDVTVNDPYASGKHCRITEVDGRYFVEDLGSTNGTFLVPPGSRSILDHVKVYGPTAIPVGSRVRIGRTTLPWEQDEQVDGP